MRDAAGEASRSRVRRAVPHAVAIVAALGLAACARSAPGGSHACLLFAGTGTSPNDVAAIETILRRRHLEFATVTSAELNAMSETGLRACRLLIVPGGNFVEMGQGLTSATAKNVQSAVRGGTNYLGICAGGLLAGAARDHGFDLAGGVRFGFYSAVERGVHKAAVPIACVGAPAIEHYWEDGPQYTGWGDVVGRYPDGTPAIVQGRSGAGWVLLVGTHPEAPDRWRRGMRFETPARSSNDFAEALVDAAWNGTALPHF